MLKNGFYIYDKNDKTNVQLINIEILIGLCGDNCIEEQEWEFPKGRRKLGEKDFNCAVREFREESTVHSPELHFFDSSKFFDEVYFSMNKTRYRNVYYIAKFNSKNGKRGLFDKSNNLQTKEVRDVQWIPFETILDKFKHRNLEKIELIKHVNDVIKKKYENIK
jgi:8-oxo-dGTP pyrophosphatase MutT (NUDIX family)